MKKLAFLLLFFLCFLLLKAQRPTLYFENITIQNGLSHNKVNCILQDKRGFMWFGTDDGLNRFDGKNFIHFRHRFNDSTSISGNIITDLLEDKNEVLWIATADGGLSRYNYRLHPSRQIKQYKHTPDKKGTIPANIINALLEDKYGNLWLATSGSSVLCFNKTTEVFTTVPKNSKTVLDLHLDKDGIIWAGREGSGIVKINPQNLTYEEDKRYQDLYAKLPHAAVTALYLDSDKNMWFGSWDKVLYKYDHSIAKEEVYEKQGVYSFENDEILSFAEDRDGMLWMGGSEKGLHIYDKNSNRFYNYRSDVAREGSIADNRVNCIYRDASGRMWLGTSKGISINNTYKQQFVQTFLNPLGSSTQVYDFYEDEDNNTWIGTSDGIYIKKTDGTIIHRPLQFKGEKIHATHFYKNGDGTFFIGSDYSVFQYNPETNSLQLLPNTDKDGVMNRIIDSRITSMMEHTISGSKVLLTAPFGHFLTYYDHTLQQWISRLDTNRKIVEHFNLTDNRIRKFFKSKTGTLWITTSKSGLGLWREKPSPAFIYFNHKPGAENTLTSNNISDVIEDEKGFLWVSTYGGGLHRFDQVRNEFHHIAASNNLLEGLQVDHHGNIWMISNGNLHKYDPKRKSYTSYTLPDLERKGGVKGKIFKDRKGKLYVAGLNYFISFHPDSVQEAVSQPKVYLTDFFIFNNSQNHLLWQNEVKLNYKENYFTIDFAAPYFAPGTGVQYAYKLEGFNEDWVNVGERNYVSYSNLEGGEYVFKVRATNTPGVWNSEYASIKLVVVPPFWKTIWFYIVSGLLTIAAILLLYRYRINELIKRQAIRNKIAQDLHDNVGSTLSSISVYSQVAKIYHQQHKENDLQHTLERISATSSEMISELNDTVWAINPRNDNMEVILQRMQSFARPLLASQNIKLHFFYDPHITVINLDMEKRKNFYLIYKEAVNNCLKYSGCQNLDVRIEKAGDKISMRINDDGKGFDMTKTSEGFKSSDVYGGGNGLKNMQLRAKEMKGNVQIKSQPGKGTLVEFQFPIT